MTTILDTLGIATCQVSYGKEASFAGAFASASIVVYPKALGVSQLRLTWAATGDMLTSFSDSTTADPGSPGIIVLPQTGQAGFRHGQSTFQDWYYEAVVTSTVNGQTASRTYRFQIPAGQTTLDLDALDEDGQVTGQPAIAPILPEPAGLSAGTRASLSTTYPALRSTAPSTSERTAGTVAYIDTSTVPPTLKGWNGGAWVALGGSSNSSTVTLIDNGDGTFTLTTGGGTAYLPLALDTDGVPYFTAGAYASLDTDGVPYFTATPDSTSKAVLTDTDGVFYLAA